MSPRPHRFDEALLSGYVDEELTQGDEQRVRLHLEDCHECSRTVDELRQIKEATMTTEFDVPGDTQWDETPRSRLSGFVRTFGWLIAGVWVVVTAGYAVWQILRDAENTFEVVVVFGFWLAFGLVFLSVLIDRLKTRKTDPYRRVQR